MSQIENHFTAAQKITEGRAKGFTMVHDQHSTNLCHSFATMSGFRQILLNFAEKAKSEIGSNEAGCQEVIDGINTKGEFSFNRMLAVFLGCVSPRSYSGKNQSGKTEKIISRLVSKTAFETEGWKRIIPVRKMFEKMNLKIDDYELSYEKVNHPNSHSVKTVLEKLKGSSYFEPAVGKFEVKIQKILNFFKNF